ncbi:MAG: NAD-dependent epimerase/dehydratase family protein [Gemmatimonadota bacterium]|nr:MAG: NAD-dependent epimerase/dehydratase family protein [Gemmatimonadota bacterium]
MQGKILVTGANGYTGYYFSKYLAEKGLPVRAMYYPPDGKPDLKGDTLELVPGDITKRDQVQAAVDGIEVVQHVAALYRPTNVPKQAFYDVNVEGTRNMVELSAEAGVKTFVNVSTIGVHGTTGRTPIDEDGPIRPDDYYQETKWLGEKLAFELAPKLDLPLTCIRPAGIYGPRERRFLKIAQLVKRRRFMMFGSGETYYHFVHVRDLCDAFMLAAEKIEKSAGRTYIIADDHAISLNHMVQCLAEAAGVKPPQMRMPYWTLKAAAYFFEGVCKPFRISPPMHRRRAAWFVSNRCFNIARAREELGYDPQVKIEDGIHEMVKSFEEAGWM